MIRNGLGPTSVLQPWTFDLSFMQQTVLLTVIGALLALGGLWRVPGLVLVEPAPLRCPLEEEA